jgi:hypothetical protein
MTTKLFRIGDRVRLIEDDMGHPPNKVATIIDPHIPGVGGRKGCTLVRLDPTFKGGGGLLWYSRVASIEHLFDE